MTGHVEPGDYGVLLESIKREIAGSRVRAARAVNTELIGMYWRIGGLILDRQADQGWGTRVIDRLAADLRTSFPDARGFSRRNLHYMRALAGAWPTGPGSPPGKCCSSPPADHQPQSLPDHPAQQRDQGHQWKSRSDRPLNHAHAATRTLHIPPRTDNCRNGGSGLNGPVRRVSQPNFLLVGLGEHRLGRI